MIAGERESWFFVHGVTAEAWAKRWDIEPFSAPCRGCRRTLTTTLPFASGTLRGLAAPHCVCGHHDRVLPGGVTSLPPYCIVRDPRHGDLFTGSDKTTRRRTKAPDTA